LAQKREKSLRRKKGSIKRKGHYKLTAIKIYVVWLKVAAESLYIVVSAQIPMKKLQVAKVIR
jgi:hypothetical protein